MRFYPQAKLLWHHNRVDKWLKEGHTSPVLVEISPTAYCSASCSWCFFKKSRSNKQIDSDLMLDTIEEIACLDVKAINWTGGGEPTLHPDFDEFVMRAARYGLKQGLFTNGYQKIPHQDKFEWIRISLTEEGIKRIKKPRVPFGICLNQLKSHTREELEALCVQAKKFGASYFQVRPALIGHYRKQPYLEAPLYLKKHRTKKFDVCVTEYKYEEATHPKRYKYCYGYHFCPSIDWEGKLNVCLYLRNKKQFRLADLSKTELLYIWPVIKERVAIIEGCQNCCKNHEINKILYAAKDMKSVEFL